MGAMTAPTAPSLDRYLAGVPCWLELRTPDVDAAAAFWRAVLRWRVDGPDASGRRVARVDGQVVAGIAPAARAWWSTAIAVDDVPAAAERVGAAGGTVLMGPDGTADCTDPAGASFSLRALGDRPVAERVNADGGWNWSDLATSDPAAAIAFYGALFGWAATDVAMGPETATMWRRPGYGDHLATLDPTLRERHGADGVPAGFSDAIGWLVPTEPGEADAWKVTLAVDDVDGAVAAATAEGATVVVAPVDAGPARLAVIADPAGVATTLSHYQP